MKKYILFLFLYACCYTIDAQNVNADCIDAIPLCTTPSFTFYATSGGGSVADFSVSSSVSNPTNNPFLPDNGCLKSGELNPQWLLLTVGNAGLLEFVFGAGNSANPQAGCYDWIMWPYSPSTCANIFNNTLAPIRCNWNATCSNGTGLASAANIAALGGNSGDYGDPLMVNACQQFIICISNYSNINTLVSFQSIGTASLSCNPNCSPNYSMCSGSSATIVPVNFAALSNPTFVIQPGGQSNTTGSFVVSPVVTSTYSLFITGLNSTNAVQTISATSIVSVMPQPSAVPSLTQATCTNSLTSIQLGLFFTPPTAPSYNIVWSPIPNGILNNTQTAVTAYIPGGTYFATVTAAGGCSTTVSVSINPAPTIPVINLSPSAQNFTLDCINSNYTVNALDASINYTWTNGLIAPITGPFADFTYTSTGTWTIYAQDPNSGCVSTKTIVIGANISPPTSSLSSVFQNITCNQTAATSVTATASPSINVSCLIYAPQGGTFTAAGNVLVYTPGSVGIYTFCAIDNTNGCTTCSNFTVTSNQGFPTFSLSSPQSFTLGCTTKSVAIIDIVGATTTNTNQIPTAGPVSYTLIGPGTSTTIPTGSVPLSGQSSYSVTLPGTYTVITKDNTSFCETRVPLSVISNTAGPNISAIVPFQILDCDFPKVKLIGQSATSNVSYNWSWPAIPGNAPSDSISVYADYTAPTKTIVAQYTLTITDNSSTCKSNSIVPIYQNMFLPKALISNGGVSALTCKTPTVTLTNQSSTGILANTGFPTGSAVVATLWEGPTPQEDLQLSTTYVGATPGDYTVTVKDLNNGCVNKATITILNQVIYPVLSFPEPSILDCSTGLAIITVSTSYAPTGTSYTITPPPGGQINPNVSTTPTFTSTILGQHRITAINPANGCGASAIQTVVAGILTAKMASDQQEGYMPLTVTFTNLSSTNSNTVLTQNNASKIKSTWDFANGTSSVVPSSTIFPQTVFAAPGKYRVKMYSYSGSCFDTASVLILVKLPSSIEIPNIFTPNGDGNNDVFFLHTKGMGDVEMEFTDRWGHYVTSVKSNSGNIIWDGKNSRGQECSDGVYFYVLKASGLDGKSFETSGTVTIIR